RTLALSELPALVNTIGETVFLSAWGERGPAIVHVADAPKPISIRPTAQGDLPLHNSATGRVFAAYLERDRLDALIEAELDTLRREHRLSFTDTAALKRGLIRQIPDIRRRRLARSMGERYPGLNSFAAPIFNRQGHVILALTSFGLAT